MLLIFLESIYRLCFGWNVMKRSFLATFLFRTLALLSVASSSLLADPGRDNFFPANTLPVLESPLDSEWMNLTTFSKEADEPSHNPAGSGVSAGKSAWWRWVAPANGYCTVDTRTSRDLNQPVRSATVAVYRAHPILAPNFDTITPVVKSNYSLDLGTDSTSRFGKVTFLAEEGKTYFIAVDARTNADWDAVNHFGIGMDLRFYEPKNETRMGLVGLPYLSGAQVGIASFNLTQKGGFGGSVQMFGKRHSFRGQVSADGFFYVSVPQPNPPGSTPAAPLLLVCDVLGRGKLFTLDSIADSDSNHFNAVQKFGKGNYFAGAGYYTHNMEFAGGTGGFGLGSCRMTRTGGVRGSMELPDGQKLTYSAKLLEDGGSPSFVFVRHLFKGAGFAWFSLGHTGANNGLSYNEGAYRRPAIAGDPFYPNGLNTEVYLEGGKYEVPASSATPFGLLSDSSGVGKMVIPATAGEDINVPTELPLTFLANQFAFSAPNSFGASIKFNRRTGIGSGKIQIPLSQAARTLRVVCTRFPGNDPEIKGRLTGTTRTVAFTIVAP
jgi:hypothetical protein